VQAKPSRTSHPSDDVGFGYSRVSQGKEQAIAGGVKTPIFREQQEVGGRFLVLSNLGKQSSVKNEVEHAGASKPGECIVTPHTFS
jgi:hypothetical protein